MYTSNASATKHDLSYYNISGAKYIQNNTVLVQYHIGFLSSTKHLTLTCRDVGHRGDPTTTDPLSTEDTEFGK